MCLRNQLKNQNTSCSSPKVTGGCKFSPTIIKPRVGQQNRAPGRPPKPQPLFLKGSLKQMLRNWKNNPSLVVKPAPTCISTRCRSYSFLRANSDLCLPEDQKPVDTLENITHRTKTIHINSLAVSETFATQCEHLVITSLTGIMLNMCLSKSKN